MNRSSFALAAALLLGGFASNASATNLYYQYSASPLKICQVKIASGVDIVADTIGGTYAVGTGFASPPPNGKTEAGDIYIAAATQDANTCGTSQQGGALPVTPTVGIAVPVTTLAQGVSTTPINISIANATQCTASATYTPPTGGTSSISVAGWSGTVCSSLSTCSALTSATANNLSTGTYVFGLTCIDTVVTGNVTATATAPLAVTQSLTANTTVSNSACPSPPVYTGGTLTRQLLVTDTSTGTTTNNSDFATIFGSVAGSDTYTPWPGILNNNTVQALTINANSYLAFALPVTGSHGGRIYSQTSAFQSPVSITISTCPGDFRTAVVPGVMGADCFKSISGSSQSITWDTIANGTAPGTCHLTPGTNYFLNIINAPLSYPARPTFNCPQGNGSGGGSCGAGVVNRPTS